MSRRKPSIVLLGAIAATALVPAAALAALVTPQPASPQVVTPQAVTAPSAAAAPATSTYVPSAASAPAFSPSSSAGSSPASSPPSSGRQSFMGLVGSFPAAEPSEPKFEAKKEERRLEVEDWTAEMETLLSIYAMAESFVGPITVDLTVPESMKEVVSGGIPGVNPIIVPGRHRRGMVLGQPPTFGGPENCGEKKTEDKGVTPCVK